VALTVSDLDEAQEQEPNTTGQANRAVPGAITCRLLEKGDIDHLVFAVKKGSD
jgi:hypothetical protein